ncbi:MAG TPA: glycosyltransferase family 39 protein [Candidatus Polarisedimenticolia bacterium]
MTAENTTLPGGSQEERARTRRTLAIAFAAALAVRAGAAWFCGAAQPQEIRYITIARGIASGQGFVGLDNRYPDIIQPPLYPLILSWVFRLPGPELGLARGVSALMGALMVFTGAGMARRLFGERAARRTAWLVAVYPLLSHMSGAAITESTFTLLVTCAVLVLWRSLDAEVPPGKGLPLAASGALLGLSFLTRPEGLTYLGAAALVAVVSGLARQRAVSSRLQAAAIRSLWLAGGFLVVAFPYLAWVRIETGRWLLAPKAVLVQVHHELIQEGQRENWKEPYGSPLFFEHVRFGLNRESTAIRSREIFANVSVGMASGVLGSEEGDPSLFEPTMAIRMVLRNFQGVYLETIKDGFVVPTLLLMLFGVGLISRPWVGPFRTSALVVFSFFAASFSFLLSHVESRFLFPAIPYVLPWIAEGWRRAELWAVASVSGSGAARAALRERAARLVVGAAVLGATIVHLIPQVQVASKRWAEHREMGLWLRETAGAGHLIMAVTPGTAYYAEGRYEVLPFADLPEVVAYARHHGVEYVVADRAEIPSLRPQLTSLLVPARSHPGLDLVVARNERTPRAIILYRVAPPLDPAR